MKVLAITLSMLASLAATASTTEEDGFTPPYASTGADSNDPVITNWPTIIYSLVQLLLSVVVTLHSSARISAVMAHSNAGDAFRPSANVPLRAAK
ncbi:hypothetical protein FQN57_001144 [Myotisia sp. PD_48]|nr:hypothetical protein FQN57_001144 [Myotisia sp. PD_48]